ncbi:acyl-CoA dehydrogenase family protein [Henriciella algicola]|uniref:Acyl-CoA dehydrogenase n=1 Tax=Henriciella algicola TaxID=1608422 RepID=A0A399RI82_9PROT|nr:acyl-CoA dehydrogenase family protein [Henriciella algicola]RIJ31356.1 acyl-CoA dehydrogenase [Henriciella algicola]
MDGSFSSQFSQTATDTDRGATERFRREVDRFLMQELTPELRDAGRATTGLKSPSWACKEWRQKLFDKGWLAPSWPKMHGGAGWSTAERLYFEQACAANDAPLIMSSGIRTIGPLLMQEGTPAQKARYLPRILTGEHEWCQGFSEAGAGSDLPALSMKAELTGDHFLLNGTKLWTSFAQMATHMYMLARSEPGSSGRDGLVFLLLDMSLPGIKVRPIRCIDGSEEICEVHFDNVKAPASSALGKAGDGWRIARVLMKIARSNNTTTGTLRQAWRAASRFVVAAENDPDLKRRLDVLEADITGFEALEARLSKEHVQLNDAARSAMMKLRASELHQEITEVALEAAPHDEKALAKYFFTRAATIYSGTSEIHRNSLARAIGCP